MNDTSSPAQPVWKIYFEPRVLAILCLGFSAGIPLALVFSTLQAWMTDENVSLKTIGLFALVSTPYAFKFLWAPLIDNARVPVLADLLGHRRAWMIVAQAGLMLSILAMGLTDPVATPVIMAGAAVMTSFWSATQDIIVDTFRIESVEEDKSAAAVFNYVTGYRFALLASGAGALALADFLQNEGYDIQSSWSVTYFVMAAFILVGVVTILLSKEPEASPNAKIRTISSDTSRSARIALRFQDAVVNPFVNFMQKPAWVAILLFVVLYKFGDAIAGVMTTPFILDIGFSKTEYAAVGKTVGLGATFAGLFVGGLLQAKLGLIKALIIAGLLQMVSNLIFCVQAVVGADIAMLAVTMGIENFAGGIGTVVFIAYLSSLCTNSLFTATQFALLTSLSSVGRTFLSSAGGYLAEWLDWIMFFALTTLAAVPGLLLLWVMAHRGLIQDLKNSPKKDPQETA